MTWLILLAALLMISACSDKTPINQFSAEMVVSDTSQSTSNKFYLRDSSYRMEQDQNNEIIAVIVDEAACLTRVLVPSEKKYLEIPCQNPVSLMNDPFQSAKYAMKVADSRLTGTENIDGYDCDIFVISREGQEMMTQWISPKLKFPIKIALIGPNALKVELKNIKEGGVDGELFKIPSDYTKMENPASQQPPLPSGP